MSERPSNAREETCSGREVGDGAHERPGLGQARLRRGMGQSEVHDAHAHGRTLLPRDHDVGGLDVPVHDAAGVTVVEGVGDLDADVHDVAQAQRLVSQEAQQVHAADDGHDEEERAFVASQIVDRHDRGVVHLGHELGLALKAFLELCRQVVRGDELDGDLAIEERVFRSINHTHAAAAELGDELVAIRQPRSDQSGFTKSKLAESTRRAAGMARSLAMIRSHAGLREARGLLPGARLRPCEEEAQGRPAPLRLPRPRDARGVRRHDGKRQDGSLPLDDRRSRHRRGARNPDRSEGRPRRSSADFPAAPAGRLPSVDQRGGRRAQRRLSGRVRKAASRALEERAGRVGRRTGSASRG